MAQASFTNAADSYPARDAPSWTEEKLMIRDAYLNAFAKACQRAGGWYALNGSGAHRGGPGGRAAATVSAAKKLRGAAG